HLNQQQQQQQSHHNHHYHPSQGQGLELINECQTLALDSITDNCQKSQHLMTNTLSSGFSSQSGGGGTISSRHRAYHKRSTTIVSQLSMESGIISDICMTPDQDNTDVLTTWPSSHPTDVILSPTTVSQKNTIKCHTSNGSGKRAELHYHLCNQQHSHHHHQQTLKDMKSPESQSHEDQS
ncbi:hypothetical protein DOY81_014380, partial [Sarcophaga bullata]